MKAKELADILLQNPECEVRIITPCDSSAGVEAPLAKGMIWGPWSALPEPYNMQIIIDPESVG